MKPRHRQLLTCLLAWLAISVALPAVATPLSVSADGEQPFTVKTQILVLMSLLGLIPIVSRVRCGVIAAMVGMALQVPGESKETLSRSGLMRSA